MVKENEIFKTNRNEKLTQIRKINAQLTKYGLKKLPYDQEKIGLFLFDRIFGAKNSIISTNSNDQCKKELIVSFFAPKAFFDSHGKLLKLLPLASSNTLTYHSWQGNCYWRDKKCLGAKNI